MADERPTVTLHDLTVLDDPAERETEEFGVPQQIGRFHVLGVLGSGGMGVVLEAHDEALERRVALKVLRSPVSGGYDRRHSLVREGRALAGLSHPNVVQVFEVGEHEEQLYIAMEMVVGPNLKEWLEARPRTFEEIRDLLCAAGRGLMAAHARGLIHRDFKPENVLVGEDGRPRVVDFGLVRRGSDSEDLTMTPVSLGPATMGGKHAGTVPFMAPEQLMGWPLDHRADQFAFCVSLYESVYGRHPFEAPGMVEIGLRIISGEMDPPPPRADVPRWLPKVIARGLSAKPEDRFPNMGALIAALDPPRRRHVRPSGALVAGAAALMSLGVLSSVLAPDASRRCAGQSTELLQAWGHERREHTEQVIRGSAVRDAEGTWQRARDRLDGYAARWRRADQQLCEVSQQSGDEQHRASQARCLDARLRDLKQLVDTIDEGDEAIIPQAVAAIGNLGKLEDCLDPASASTMDGLGLGLGLGLLASEDEAAVAEIRARIAEARLEVELERYDRVLVVLQEALARAEDQGYPSLVAEVKFRLGDALSSMGQLDEAEQALSDAFWLAQGSSQPGLAVEAGYRLIHVTGDLQLRYDDGMSWARHTQALIDRENISGGLKAWTLNNRGTVMFRHQHVDQAREAFVAALSVEGISETDEAAFSLNLGNVMYVQGDLDAAAGYYRRALQLRERNVGSSHPSLISGLVNLGTIEWDRGSLAEAQATLERALRLVDQSTERTLMRGKVLLVLGSVVYARGQTPQARQYLTRAQEEFVATVGSSHPEMGMVYLVLGDVEREDGRWREAQEYYQRAVQRLEPVLGREHSNVVETLEKLEEVEQVLAAQQPEADDTSTSGPE